MSVKQLRFFKHDFDFKNERQGEWYISDRYLLCSVSSWNHGNGVSLNVNVIEEVSKDGGNVYDCIADSFCYYDKDAKSCTISILMRAILSNEMSGMTAENAMHEILLHFAFHDIIRFYFPNYYNFCKDVFPAEQMADIKHKEYLGERKPSRLPIKIYKL